MTEPLIINGLEIRPKADLLGANLRLADLLGANLFGADLRGALTDISTSWPENLLEALGVIVL